MFPQEYLEKQFNFIFDYTQENLPSDNAWVKLITDWQQNRKNIQLTSINSQMTLDELIFYYIDGGNYLKIYDKRKSNDIQIYVLNEIEREIFLSCLDIISYNDLHNRLEISENDLKTTLTDFEKNGLVYTENNYYLSLPLSYKTSSQIYIKNDELLSNSINPPEITI